MYKKIYKSMRMLSLSVLILSVLVTLIACFAAFTGKIKNEIQEETRLIAEFLNNYPSVSMSEIYYPDKRVTIISPQGEVLYDDVVDAAGLENHSDRPEVQEALKSGTGSAERLSVSAKHTMYYYAVRLKNGNVLRVSGVMFNTMLLFAETTLAVLLLLVMIYVLSLAWAKKLTQNIITPIEQSYLSDGKESAVYEELQPFLSRISKQEDEITRQMDKVAAHKLRFSAIAENMNEGLIILNSDERISSANESAAEAIGIPCADLKGKKLSEICDNKWLVANVRKVEQGKKSNMTLSFGEKTYQVFLSPVLDKENRGGVILLMFDISEKAQAEQMRREFSANVSHELKTPLTTIRGYAQLINSGIAKEDDVLGFTQKIEKESGRLITLIEDIIELSNLDEEPEALEKQKVSLKTVAKDVIERLQMRASARGITIALHGEDSTVLGNLSHITELMYNLTDNAIKYNKENGRVDITIRPNQISVADTGIGIPAIYKERIFERFFRVDKSHSKKVNGTGLGLSIVKHIVKQCGAEITVESKEGEGSCFTVTFPSGN